MDEATATNTTAHAPAHDVDHANGHNHPHDDHGHHELKGFTGFLNHYVFSCDHKTIGIQYLITSLIFLFLGFCMILLMRWQLAYPGDALSASAFFENISTSVQNGTSYVVSSVTGAEFKPVKIETGAEEGTLSEYLFGTRQMPGGVMQPDFYNSLGAIHGTVMVFLAIVPLGFAAFGNYVMPLQIGAPDMCFPKLNATSYWLYLVGGIVMMASFFVPGGAAKSGWTSYSPLATMADPASPLFAHYIAAYGSALFSLDPLGPMLTALPFVVLCFALGIGTWYEKTGTLCYWLVVASAVTLVAAALVTFFSPNSLWGFQGLPAMSDEAGSRTFLEGNEPHALALMVAKFLTGQTLWLAALLLLIFSSLLGSVNFICTAVQLRVKGMHWMRMPFFCWAIFVTSFLLLLAFPPLQAAGVMQLMDRVADTTFFQPYGLIKDGQVAPYAGGGSPLLWQHLFWFLAHPEVYVLILPAIGIVAEVITNNTRKPIWGYRSLVYSVFVLGFLSFIVWAHHMYLTGMGIVVSTFFQATTIIISIPSVIILTALIISLWGGSIRFTTPMLFATAFLPMFGIGGLTGIPLAFSATDIYLHDTYYVIAHFHYIVAPGTIFAIFAGVYYWYPKATGRMMSEFWGRVHFWPSFILMNCIFMPMFLQGMAGMHRRWYDGGASWELTKGVVHWNEFISISALLLMIAQIPFIINFFASIWLGEKAGDNPWKSTTMEWSTPTPPPHGNFIETPVVDKGPYEYSLPNAEQDYTPQMKNAAANAKV